MKRIIQIILPALLLSQCAPKEPESALEKEIRQIETGLMKRIQIKGQTPKTFSIEEQMKLYNVPGVSIAVVRDGKIKWAKGYGIANSETGSKVDENTLFQAGSISKPIAALSALKLWEEGKVDLDTDVNTYLTNWKVEENSFTEQADVTLRLLLTHSAGMTVHGFPGYTQEDDFPTIETVLNGEGNTGKIYTDTLPGAMWRYSGGGYTIMEKVVEDVSGLPLESYMAQNILPKIGMERSTYNQPLTDEYLGNVSAAYTGDGTLISGLYHNYPEQAAAGLWTTPSDLAKYCIQVQEILKGKEDGVLSKKTIEAMLTKHKNDWGLGPALKGENDSLRFGHGGKNAGFTNDMRAYANSGDAVILMTNADRGGMLMGQIMLSISSYYDLDFAQPEIIEIVELEQEALESLAGKYRYEEEVDDIGIYYVTLVVEGNALSVDDPNDRETSTLRPTDTLTFKDAEDGDTMKFTEDADTTEFIWNGRFRFYKVE